MPINSRINNKDYEPKRRNPITLGDDSNVEQNLKPLKIDSKNTILELSETELRIGGDIEGTGAGSFASLTVDGSDVITEASDVDSLNDLSDVTYSSGDLTIDSLDKIVSGSLEFDCSGDLVFDAAGADIDFKTNGSTFSKITKTLTSTDLYIYTLSDDDDYFKISAGASGITTLSTAQDPDNSNASLKLVPDGDLELDPTTQKVIINATDALYFDGGTHTYIAETGDDILDFYVGTDKMLALDEANDKISIGATNWVAGTVAAGTITEFSAANSAYAGMVLGYTRLEGDLTNQNSYEIQNAITVEDDTHQITFKTPPSENVEIEAQFVINTGTTDTVLTVGMSDADASTGYNSIGEQYEYDYLGIFFSDDEVDDSVHTVKWLLPAAELAAVGSSNTFWIGFGTGGSTKTAFLTYGLRASHGLMAHPFIIKATALPAAIYDGQ